MGKSQDAWSWVEVAFADWRNAVDGRMSNVYAVTLDEAGIDDDRLISHWEMKQSPYEFVEWLGVKFGLTSRDEIEWGSVTIRL